MRTAATVGPGVENDGATHTQAVDQTTSDLTLETGASDPISPLKPRPGPSPSIRQRSQRPVATATRLDGTVSGAAVAGFLPYRVGSVVLAVLALAAVTVYNIEASNDQLVDLIWPALAAGSVLLVAVAVARRLTIRSGRGPTLGTRMTSFRLVAADGEVYECRAFGENQDSWVRTGDTLDVRGRFGLDHSLRVSRMTNTKTGAMSQATMTPTYRALELGRLLVILFAVIGIIGTFTTALISALD